MNEIDKKCFDRVRNRRAELLEEQPDTLRKLPEFSAETIDLPGQQQMLGVWHDKTPTGEDLFVVQLKRKIFLGYGHMFAEGFVLDSRGGIRDAEEELLWEYR